MTFPFTFHASFAISSLESSCEFEVRVGVSSDIKRPTTPLSTAPRNFASSMISVSTRHTQEYAGVTIVAMVLTSDIIVYGRTVSPNAA